MNTLTPLYRELSGNSLEYGFVTSADAVKVRIVKAPALLAMPAYSATAVAEEHVYRPNAVTPGEPWRFAASTTRDGINAYGIWFAPGANVRLEGDPPAYETVWLDGTTSLGSADRTVCLCVGT